LQPNFADYSPNARLPSYACPDRSAFFTKHIVAEAASLAKDLEKHLTKFEHNTVSYDGWSSKGRAEIYTVHITTPWPRQSYLVEGLQLTGKSTDAETLFAGITAVSFVSRLTSDTVVLKPQQIIIRFVAWRISIVVSDTTGNVKKCRAMICKKWPWILNCPDPCHQLNLMMKDIMLGSKKFPKIAAFTQVSLVLSRPLVYTNHSMKVMTIVSSITTYFSHSNYATHHLKEELKKEKDQRGIQVAGVTRFSSFSIHARSISRCLYPIQRCLTSGTVKFDTAAVSSWLIYESSKC